jgi:histidine triad (HIT) family protein
MNEDCIFCKIVAGEAPATVVHRDEHVIAVEDLRPQAPIHLLVIPCRHVPRMIDVGPRDADLLASLFFAANRLAQARGLENGFRLVVNNGPGGGQTVDHLHVHLLGGRAMRWPPG